MHASMWGSEIEETKVNGRGPDHRTLDPSQADPLDRANQDIVRSAKRILTRIIELLK